ncbi:MAG: FliM/FliN family flagellar motor C-terminal domain-containing protein [Planctomycetota bacterium]
MAELTTELADEILDACKAGAEEAAGALSRSLDSQFSLEVGEAEVLDAGEAEALDGPGLFVLLTFGEHAVAAVLPESTGLLPEWYAEPDPTGESKLSTLAQELSMLLVPESLLADAFEARRAENLLEALRAGGLEEPAAAIGLRLAAGDQNGTLQMVWPLSQPEAVFNDKEQEEVDGLAEPVAAPKPAPKPAGSIGFGNLPSYSKSLLKVSVPVKVLLAQKKERIEKVTKLSPGSIVKFEKSCEEPLLLYVGDQAVAEGEAVKVGERFGFRLSGMVMPEEHFMKVVKKSAG